MGGVERQPAGDWCLLRTNGRGTLRLVESLTEDGMEAWSPNVAMKIRLRRSRRATERTIAVMPSFVFARAEGLDRLRELELRPGRHQAFRIFRYQGSWPLFADRALDPLRAEETRLRQIETRLARANRRGVPLRVGRRVTVTEGSFGGMTGIVQRSDDRFTLVTFGGRIRLKIETFLLQDDVSSSASGPGGSTYIAAQAA